MNLCETFQADLSSLLDGELEGASQLLLFDHLVTCPGCRAFYGEARGLATLVEGISAGKPELPAERSWERIVGDSGLGDGTPSWRRTALFQVAAAAAVVLSIGLAIWLMPATEELEPLPSLSESFSEVVLGSRAGVMTDGRFLALAREILEADRRYRREIVQLISAVEAELEVEELTEESASRVEAPPPRRSWDDLEGERSSGDVRVRLF